jgi:hypothetical protein
VGNAADVKTDALGELLTKIRSTKYSKSPDRDIWAAAVKPETISVVDSDAKFTSAGVYRYMARMLLRDDALQIGAYTVSHHPTFQGFLNEQIDSDGTFLTKAALAAITHRPLTFMGPIRRS